MRSNRGENLCIMNWMNRHEPDTYRIDIGNIHVQDYSYVIINGYPSVEQKLLQIIFRTLFMTLGHAATVT